MVEVFIFKFRMRRMRWEKGCRIGSCYLERRGIEKGLYYDVRVELGNGGEREFRRGVRN